MLLGVDGGRCVMRSTRMGLGDTTHCAAAVVVSCLFFQNCEAVVATDARQPFERQICIGTCLITYIRYKYYNSGIQLPYLNYMKYVYLGILFINE
jgi:hypothetical protein